MGAELCLKGCQLQFSLLSFYLKFVKLRSCILIVGIECKVAYVVNEGCTENDDDQFEMCFKFHYFRKQRVPAK